MQGGVEARHEPARLDERDVVALGRVQDSEVTGHFCPHLEDR